jgi:hypothetical protein
MCGPAAKATFRSGTGAGWASTGTSTGRSTNEAFVHNALARRWSPQQDLWERNRDTVKVRLQIVARRSARAGGTLVLAPIRGTASEGVLLAVRSLARLLWASDRVQDTSSTSLFTEELVREVHALALRPKWTSGPHFDVLAWDVLEHLRPSVAL